jgi:hypothetical protein
MESCGWTMEDAPSNTDTRTLYSASALVHSSTKSVFHALNKLARCWIASSVTPTATVCGGMCMLCECVALVHAQDRSVGRNESCAVPNGRRIGLHGKSVSHYVMW